jgi:hypothetical protein
MEAASICFGTLCCGSDYVSKYSSSSGAIKETGDAIEEIVDGVVRIYHTGFNKAIYNYSQVCYESLVAAS